MVDKGRAKKQKVAKAFGRIVHPDFGVDDLLFVPMGQRLVGLAQIAPGARVLDVAAGRGSSLFPAAEQVGTKG